MQAAITNGALTISGLAVQSAGGNEAVVTVPTFAIRNVSASLAEREIRVGTVASSNTVVAARRVKDGRLNLLDLLRTQTNSPAVQEASATSTNAAWQLAIEQVELGDWTIQLSDRTLPRDGELVLDELALSVRGIRYPGNAPMEAQFSSRVGGHGKVSGQATFQSSPLSATGRVEVAGLELRGFQPWMEPLVKLTIETGILDAKASAWYHSPGSAGGIHFKGDLAVSDFASLDQALGKELVRWKKLSVDGVDFSQPPTRTSIDQVTFDGLEATVLIATNQSLNLLSVLPAKTNAVPSAPAGDAGAVPSAGGNTFQLGELRLDRAVIHFGDQSVQPACSFDLQQVTGAVQGLSTQPGSAAEVLLTGLLGEGAPFEVKGKISALSTNFGLELVLTNQSLQLTPFTPYMEKYAGYPLLKGRLSLNLDYSLRDQQLKAQNNVRLDQLVLGPRKESPEATKLPVKLAVALLKDNSGHIDLNLPIEGRLDDPEFSVGPVVLKVIVNLIAKAVASPFKLLGALVGGGEELSFVEFTPGQAQVMAAETNKLNRLLQALEKRPGLNLEIEGSLDPGADRDALALGLIQDEARSRRMQELAAIGQSPAQTGDFQIEPADYERLLRVLVTERCGTNLTEALRAISDRASAVTNAGAGATKAVRGPSLMQRAASLFKPRAERAAIGQAHRIAEADLLLRKQNPALESLSAREMELLLVARTEVAADRLLALSQARAKAVQGYVLASGRLTAERLFLLAPRAPGTTEGGARVNMSLN